MHGSDYSGDDNSEKIAEQNALLILYRAYADAARTLPTDHPLYGEVEHTAGILSELLGELNLLYIADRLPAIEPDATLTALVGLLSAVEFAQDAMPEQPIVPAIKSGLDVSRRDFARHIVAAAIAR